MIYMIAAVAKNRAIGFKNNLIYRLPNDLKRFKALTIGNTILMGMNTYKSLPKGALPNRRNCVLSKSVKKLPDCECFSSWEEFIDSCNPDEDIYIIGGASIYGQFIDKADCLRLTEIDDVPEEADAFFPEYADEWHPVSKESHMKDERHDFDYSFVDYERKENS